MTSQCQTLITGGRVVDPRHHIDEVLTIGITDGRIVHVDSEPITAAHTIDATGFVVAPGFVDMHSHAQNEIGHLLQAYDGVTTSLELECGAAPLNRTLNAAAEEGRALNYGYSASWLLARMMVMEGMDSDQVARLPTLPLEMFSAMQGSGNWAKPASEEERRAIIELVSQQLDDGAIGIGVLLGYAPAIDSAELHALARLAADRNTTLFVHARYGAEIEGHTAHESVSELVELSESTGARIHICHFASSNAGDAKKSTRVLSDAIDRGLPMTTESYPFEFASTVIGADFLSPEILRSNSTPASTITYLPGSEQVSSYDRLAELRAQDPGGLCLIQYYGPDLPVGVDELISTLSFPGAAFASDAMPLTRLTGGDEGKPFPTALPVPPGYAVHPRSGSCFIRAIAWLHRDTGLMDLSDVVSRSSDIPARILARSAPSFEAKGHLGVGADADIVIIDIDTAVPRFEPAPVTTAVGVVYLFVNGEMLIENRETTETAVAKGGRALLATASVAEQAGTQ
ncbi:amidohydrolase family protein [Brevibacterium sp. UCMA 11752]|uniref:amidohydrolase family protein n=1 Tax=Brevibacterium sp. UCMA 11752 TaxID=2745946 RepID=UPI001EF32F41|nr:amidohydrolase family protein [Brevibacterium sp. UCMA 11752]MCF2587356.1 amidohydrolase family protein [Brevibacterium sp. UCMA 11752]